MRNIIFDRNVAASINPFISMHGPDWTLDNVVAALHDIADIANNHEKPCKATVAFLADAMAFALIFESGEMVEQRKNAKLELVTKEAVHG